jgi:phosphoglycerol transferase MdoB-like AlkP superfamily enzyme
MTTPRIALISWALLLLASSFQVAAFGAELGQISGFGFLGLKTALAACFLLPVLAGTVLLGRTWVLLAFYVAKACFLGINLAYFSYFHFYLNPVIAWDLLAEGVATAGRGGIPNLESLWLLALDLPFLVMAALSLKGLHQMVSRQRALGLALVLLPLFLPLFYEAYNHAERQNLAKLLEDETKTGQQRIVQVYGTLVNFLVNLRLSLSEDAIIAELDPGPEIGGPGTGEKRSLVLIQVEALGAGLPETQVDGRPLMPFLASLRNQGAYFPEVLAIHLAGGTSDAEFSIINSVVPSAQRPSMKLRSYSYPNSFVARLAAAGYQTLAFHGNDGSFFDRAEAFPRMGFKAFLDQKSLGLPTDTWGADDARLFEAVGDRILPLTQPFLAYIITMSSHTPFDLLSLGRQPSPDISVRYLAVMKAIDQRLQVFVERLRAQRPDLVILILGDHAPGDFHPSYKSVAGKVQETVPLFILGPGIAQPPTTTKANPSFVDLAPTVLSLTGMPWTLRSRGQPLLQ